MRPNLFACHICCFELRTLKTWMCRCGDLVHTWRIWSSFHICQLTAWRSHIFPAIDWVEWYCLLCMTVPNVSLVCPLFQWRQSVHLANISPYLIASRITVKYQRAKGGGSYQNWGLLTIQGQFKALSGKWDDTFNGVARVFQLQGAQKYRLNVRMCGCFDPKRSERIQ